MPATANNIPAQTYYGLAISWGLGATTITVGGVNVGLGQSTATKMMTDQQLSRDQRGTVVQETRYNPNDTATMEFIFAIAGSYDSGTASITYPTQGTMVAVVAGDPSDPLSGSNWIVDHVEVRGSNTEAKKVGLDVHRFGGVTQ